MRSLKRVGQACAGVMIAVGLLHILVGFRGITLLGVSLPASVLVDPVLDSQDRFYGAMLGGLGALLLYGLADIPRYHGVITLIAWTVIVGGLGRILSIFVTGWPSSLIMLFIVVEFVLPAILLHLLARAVAGTRQS